MDFSFVNDWLEGANDFRHEHTEIYTTILLAVMYMLWYSVKSVFGRGKDVQMAGEAGFVQTVLGDKDRWTVTSYNRGGIRYGEDNSGKIAIFPRKKLIEVNGTNVSHRFARKDRKRLFALARTVMQYRKQVVRAHEEQNESDMVRVAFANVLNTAKDGNATPKPVANKPVANNPATGFKS